MPLYTILSDSISMGPIDANDVDEVARIFAERLGIDEIDGIDDLTLHFEKVGECLIVHRDVQLIGFEVV